jgi:hypothetical protein
MAQSDFTSPSNVLTSSNVLRVETAAFTAPNGGGAFVQAYKSVSVSSGIVAQFYNGAGFTPTGATKAGIARAAMKRATSGGPSGWAPFVFVSLSGTDVASTAYVLGIGDASPGHLILMKGPLNGGLPDVAPGTAGSGVIWRSDESVPIDEWAHIQLMVAGNANGDAVISIYRSDLGTSTLSLPSMVLVPGRRVAQGGGTVADTGLTDDGAGILTGSPAYASGRLGYGCYFSDVSRVAMFDGLYFEAQP